MLLIACSLAFAVLTLATALATSILQFAILRGLAGIFMSGGLPMAIALLSELTPRARRGTFISIAFIGYSAGGAAGGAVAAWMIDDHGWQSGFWLGGCLFGLFRHEEAVLRAHGVPAGWRAAGTVALGHPAASRPGRSAGRPRPPLRDVVRRGRWSET